VLIRLHHARELKYCSRGIRYWCKQKGIDYIKFIKEGIEEEVLLAFNDSMAKRVVEHAKKVESE